MHNSLHICTEQRNRILTRLCCHLSLLAPSIYLTYSHYVHSCGVWHIWYTHIVHHSLFKVQCGNSTSVLNKGTGYWLGCVVVFLHWAPSLYLKHSHLCPQTVESDTFCSNALHSVRGMWQQKICTEQRNRILTGLCCRLSLQGTIHISHRLLLLASQWSRHKLPSSPLHTHTSWQQWHCCYHHVGCEL